MKTSAVSADSPRPSLRNSLFALCLAAGFSSQMRDPGGPEVNRSPPHIRAFSSEPVLSHSQRMTFGDTACERSRECHERLTVRLAAGIIP